MPGATDEREFFTRRYEGIEPDALWKAVKRALATMDIKDADDAQRTAQFSTGISLTSWGQNMLASVAGGGAEGSTLAVSGRPKGSLFTTKMGEDMHANGIEKQIVRAVEAELGTAAA